ncbi:MAG: Kiwa anti-phage protein KwaB-like domain-containing protein [Clostridium chrysemydis]|uniref:Kiwa anti-phage protein KwaB-like domain-containing protein n=1 Tax=Clostridium chrysemydis TaxID=2665504 RepID=UPI003F313F9B
MPYRRSLEELQGELLNRDNGLALFLQTNTNIFSFRSALSEEQQLEIINPINEFMSNKEYSQYDALERMPNTIYYITSEMAEYQSLNNILEVNQQLENGQVDRATIRAIETDKIKMIIFKKGRFIFLYKYNSGKLFKQGWKARFDNEEAVVEKETDNVLLLSKLVPDIIVDVECELAFVLNVVQAEYILEIDSLFTGTLNNFSNNLRDFNLMREDTIEGFITQVMGKNNYMRKLHKIQTTQSYQYFHQNISKIPDVLAQYGLTINFDEANGQIVFDDETDVGDVLHLFADDYVKRYISERDDVMK